jgi:hypothetical protein
MLHFQIIRLIILFLSLMGSIYAQPSLLQTDDVIAYRNYGVYLRPIKTVWITTEKWYHIVHIELPKPHEFTWNPTQGCPTEYFCNNKQFAFFFDTIRKMDEKEKNILLDTVNNLNNLIPQSPPPSNLRSKRGMINFIGHALHFLFGTATDDQIQQIGKTVEQIQQNTELAMDTIAATNEQLTSYIKVANHNFKTFEKVAQDQHLAFTNLYDNVRQFRSETTMQLLTLASSLDRIADFTVNLQLIEELHTALTLATHGTLTTDLIPLTIVNDSIKFITQKSQGKQHSSLPHSYYTSSCLQF